MTKTMLAPVVAGSLLLPCAGCGKNEDGAAKLTTPRTAASSDTIGIQECDEYLTKYAACIAKVPATVKEPAERGFKRLKDEWKASANQDATKASCKAALDGLPSNPMCK